MHRLVIHGPRGSCPQTGADKLRYGGHTACFSVETPDDWLVIDAGTGLCHVNARMAGRSALPPVTLLFTHLHMDHVDALPGFAALRRPGAQVTLMADPRRDEDWKAALRTLAAPPFWPLSLDRAPAAVRFADWPGDLGSLSLHALTLRIFRVPHPQQCIAVRIDSPGQSVVVATDFEYAPDGLDPAFVAFCAGADALVADAHFAPEEFPLHRGWGHSTWETGVNLALQAGVGQLILTHHAPARTDAEVEALLAAARDRFPRTWAARENLSVPVREEGERP